MSKRKRGAELQQHLDDMRSYLSHPPRFDKMWLYFGLADCHVAILYFDRLEETHRCLEHVYLGCLVLARKYMSDFVPTNQEVLDQLDYPLSLDEFNKLESTLWTGLGYNMGVDRADVERSLSRFYLSL